MRFLTAFVPVALLATALSGQMPAGPVDALDGLDPVLLVQGKEVPGKSALSAGHGGFTYLFATADNKAAFERTPDKYAIQLGGLCARMGKATGGNPSDFLVHDGKIYVFGSDECHKRFQAAPTKYLPPAAKPVPTGADARERGRKLLDDAARAIGPTLDAVATFSESYAQVQKRGEAEVRFTTKTMWKFPDRARQDRRAEFEGKPVGSSTLVTPDGAWYLTLQGQAYPAPSAGVPSLQADFGRHPIALLRNRRRAGAIAIAEAPGAVDGVNVQRIRIVDGAIDAIVTLDPARRIHSVSYVDRNSEGAYGTFTVRYSDYRAAEGLRLPFNVRTLFDGQPYPQQSWTVEAIAVNPTLDGSAFTPPSKSTAGRD